MKPLKIRRASLMRASSSPVRVEIGSHSLVRWRQVMRWILAAFYILAGILHITGPAQFLPIVPGWVPFPNQVVLATGLCEIVGGFALLTLRLRVLAGVMLALYAACVFPSNIKHAIQGIDLPPVPNSWWYHGPRLAFQPVLIWWALFSSGAIGWPFARREVGTTADVGD